MKKCILSVVILLAALLSVCVSYAETGSIDKLPQKVVAESNTERGLTAAGIPEFTEYYGLNEYYDHIKELNGGLFRFWSPENKAEFYRMIPTLWQMEEKRVFSISEDYRPDLSVLSSISVRHYICPDDSMIPQDRAIEYATRWVLNNNYLSEDELDECSISVSCIQLTNDCEWSVGFWDHSIEKVTVHMNAFTGEIPLLDEVQVKNLVIHFSEAVGAPSAIKLSDLFYGAGFDYINHQWKFIFIDHLDDGGIVYIVEDLTMEVVPGANG